MTSGFVLGPGEGPAYGFHGSAAVIKASGEDTLGQLGVIESARTRCFTCSLEK